MTVFIAAVDHRSIIAKKGESAQGGAAQGLRLARPAWRDQPGGTWVWPSALCALRI
jgi:hypothetical protein